MLVQHKGRRICLNANGRMIRCECICSCQFADPTRVPCCLKVTLNDINTCSQSSFINVIFVAGEGGPFPSATISGSSEHTLENTGQLEGLEVHLIWVRDCTWFGSRALANKIVRTFQTGHAGDLDFEITPPQQQTVNVWVYRWSADKYHILVSITGALLPFRADGGSHLNNHFGMVMLDLLVMDQDFDAPSAFDDDPDGVEVVTNVFTSDTGGEHGNCHGYGNVTFPNGPGGFYGGTAAIQRAPRQNCINAAVTNPFFCQRCCQVFRLHLIGGDDGEIEADLWIIGNACLWFGNSDHFTAIIQPTLDDDENPIWELTVTQIERDPDTGQITTIRRAVGTEPMTNENDEAICPPEGGFANLHSEAGLFDTPPEIRMTEFVCACRDNHDFCPPCLTLRYTDSDDVQHTIDLEVDEGGSTWNGSKDGATASMYCQRVDPDSTPAATSMVLRLDITQDDVMYSFVRPISAVPGTFWPLAFCPSPFADSSSPFIFWKSTPAGHTPPVLNSMLPCATAECDKCFQMGTSGSITIGCEGDLSIIQNDGDTSDNESAEPNGWTVGITKNGVFQGFFNFETSPGHSHLTTVTTGIHFVPGDVLSWEATGSIYMNSTDCRADPNGTVTGSCTAGTSTDGRAGCPDLIPWSLVGNIPA